MFLCSCLAHTWRYCTEAYDMNTIKAFPGTMGWVLKSSSGVFITKTQFHSTNEQFERVWKIIETKVFKTVCHLQGNEIVVNAVADKNMLARYWEEASGKEVWLNAVDKIRGAKHGGGIECKECAICGTSSFIGVRLNTSTVIAKQYLTEISTMV